MDQDKTCFIAVKSNPGYNLDLRGNGNMSLGIYNNQNQYHSRTVGVLSDDV